MNVQVTIGEDVTVAIEDESEPNLEALETLLRRVGDEALRINTILTLQAMAAEVAAKQLEAE